MFYTQGETRIYAVTSKPGVTATIASPTEGQRRKLLPKNGRSAAEDPTAFYAWCGDVVRAHVTKLEGYAHKGKTIATGADLAEYGEDVVLAELAAEVYAETSLTEVDGKNSDAPSATPPSAG